MHAFVRGGGEAAGELAGGGDVPGSSMRLPRACMHIAQCCFSHNMLHHAVRPAGSDVTGLTSLQTTGCDLTAFTDKSHYLFQWL